MQGPAPAPARTDIELILINLKVCLTQRSASWYKVGLEGALARDSEHCEVTKAHFYFARINQFQ